MTNEKIAAKNNLRHMIVLGYPSMEERNTAGASIHDVLAGNPEYVNNDIILNIDGYDADTGMYLVRLYVFTGAKTDIQVAIRAITPDDVNEEGEEC